MKAGIYKITNKITGCVYIGSSKDLKVRLSRYKEPKMAHVTKNIKESILEYGIDNHQFRILAEFDCNISKKRIGNLRGCIYIIICTSFRRR